MPIMLWVEKKKDVAVLPDINLEGFRVLVRPAQYQDWQEWAALRTKNKEYLTPLEPQWAEDYQSEEFFVRRLERQSRAWKFGLAYSFLIFERHDNVMLGGVNLNHVCRGAAQHASLGYWIDEDYQGQGYMTESLRLVIEYAFDELKLMRLNAACLPDNIRSQNVLTRLGFEKEGFAKSYLQINGIWQDHILFGLTPPARD